MNVSDQEVLEFPRATPHVLHMTLFVCAHVVGCEHHGRVVIGERFPLKGCHSRRVEDLFFRAVDRDNILRIFAHLSA